MGEFEIEQRFYGPFESMLREEVAKKGPPQSCAGGDDGRRGGDAEPVQPVRPISEMTILGLPGQEQLMMLRSPALDDDVRA
jgi:hypothetical protein